MLLAEPFLAESGDATVAGAGDDARINEHPNDYVGVKAKAEARTCRQSSLVSGALLFEVGGQVPNKSWPASG
jgi:hypothetical protein